MFLFFYSELRSQYAVHAPFAFLLAENLQVSISILRASSPPGYGPCLSVLSRWGPSWLIGTTVLL